MWLIPEQANIFVQAVLNLEATAFANFTELKDTLRRFFYDTVLPKAGVARKIASGRAYNLRTVRALRATQFVKLLKEYQVMKWEPMPLNPLTHTSL